MERDMLYLQKQQLRREHHKESEGKESRENYFSERKCFVSNPVASQLDAKSLNSQRGIDFSFSEPSPSICLEPTDAQKHASYTTLYILSPTLRALATTAGLGGQRRLL